MSIPSPSIAIAGSATLHPHPDECMALAREVGVALAEQKALLVCGIENTLDHLPETALQGLIDAGGERALGVFRTRKDLLACSYRNVIPVVTGMERGAGWEAVIVLSAQALIVIGGRTGTMQEVAIALQAGIPVIALEGSSGCADLLGEEFLGFKIHKADTPSDAAALAAQLADAKEKGVR